MLPLIVPMEEIWGGERGYDTFISSFKFPTMNIALFIRVKRVIFLNILKVNEEWKAR